VKDPEYAYSITITSSAGIRGTIRVRGKRSEERYVTPDRSGKCVYG
jgi:hypothetical protein